MSASRRLPSYLVPTKATKLNEYLAILPATPVKVLDDWGGVHLSGSITIEYDERKSGRDKWVYFHSLLVDSRLLLYSFQAFGNTDKDFNVNDFIPGEYPGASPRIILCDYENILPAVYLDHKIEERRSYKDIYQVFLNPDTSYLAAIHAYFLAQDIDFNKRLRYQDASYWQVVMLMSAMEALLPKPVFCKGKCGTCERTINHPINNADKDWKDLLFDKIKAKQ